MNYKNYFLLFLLFFYLGVNKTTLIIKIKNINIEKRYKNSGFALIYNDNLEKYKKLDNRSLNIYHKSLKKKIYCKNYKSKKMENI